MFDNKGKAEVKRPGQPVKLDRKPPLVSNFEQELMRTFQVDLPYEYRAGWEGEFDWEYDIARDLYRLRLTLRNDDKHIMHQAKVQADDLQGYVIARANSMARDMTAEIKAAVDGGPLAKPKDDDEVKENYAQQEVKEKARRKTKAKRDARVQKSTECPICGEVDPDEGWGVCPHVE